MAGHPTDYRASVITVDGPSGSGKGTIGFRLAQALGWHFLDSGAVYRALALAALAHLPHDLDNEQALEILARDLDLRFDSQILLEGKNVTEQIRSSECGQMASRIAVFPNVRAALLDRQRAFCEPPGLVADGRDMGTVVFPKAILKIYLEASDLVRAERRYLQLKDTQHSVTMESLLKGIRERDARDKDRAVAPLQPAEDAVVFDTTAIGIEEVFIQVMHHVKQRLY
jgi:cytidylate kinase